MLPRSHVAGRKPAVNDKHLLLVKTLLNKQPDMTLDELCNALKKKTGTRVSITTYIWRKMIDDLSDSLIIEICYLCPRRKFFKKGL